MPTHQEIDAAVSKSSDYLGRYFPIVVSSKVVSSTWRSRQIFRDPHLYEAFSASPDLIEKTTDAWYHGKNQFVAIRNALPARFWSLALDPGIQIHAKQFVEFAREFLVQNGQLSPIELRNAFSESLGSKKVYRGLALTQRELQDILKNGLSPGILNFLPYKDENYQLTEAQRMIYRPGSRLETELRNWMSFLNKGPVTSISSRVTSGGDGNFSQSLTDFPSIARTVSKSFNTSSRQVVVFQLQIPRLDILTASELNLDLNPTPFTAEGRQFLLNDDGVERFVFGEIPSQWIESYREGARASKSP